MSRTFAPISIEDLKVKLDAANADGYHELISLLGNDIKVSFDLENVADSPKDFGPSSIIGFHTEASGLTYCGIAAGGDWEHPVFFIVYWDGKKLRGYVPTEGNPWNTDTKSAYGNDDEADAKNAHKRWPDLYDGSEIDTGDFEFNPELIRKDITERITPKVKAKSAPKNQPALPVARTVPVSQSLSSARTLQERIESLIYFGIGDEAFELFQQTCSLCYSMHGLGVVGKAEILCSWAEEMAYESKSYAEPDAETGKGIWGR